MHCRCGQVDREIGAVAVQAAQRHDVAVSLIADGGERPQPPANSTWRRPDQPRPRRQNQRRLRRSEAATTSLAIGASMRHKATTLRLPPAPVIAAGTVAARKSRPRPGPATRDHCSRWPIRGDERHERMERDPADPHHCKCGLSTSARGWPWQFPRTCLRIARQATPFTGEL